MRAANGAAGNRNWQIARTTRHKGEGANGERAGRPGGSSVRQESAGGTNGEVERYGIIQETQTHEHTLCSGGFILYFQAQGRLQTKQTLIPNPSGLV